MCNKKTSIPWLGEVCYQVFCKNRLTGVTMAMLRRKSDVAVSVDLLMPRLTAAGGPKRAPLPHKRLSTSLGSRVEAKEGFGKLPRSTTCRAKTYYNISSHMLGSPFISLRQISRTGSATCLHLIPCKIVLHYRRFLFCNHRRY